MKSLWITLFLLVVTPAWAQLTPEQHSKLVETCRWLGTQRISYNQTWTPPGRSQPWGAMDCSNTTRYIFHAAFGIKIPRTASDQYYELLQKGRITPAPRRPDGSVDTDALVKNLRSGDLLFWEWTYNIKRRPPITHVMVYLGRTADGTPKMAGSSSSGRGERTYNGGVDVYVFNPNAPSGGVRNIFGGYSRVGRFVATGRVL
jgi:cell wall-associated NlpC family hydrolase